MKKLLCLLLCLLLLPIFALAEEAPGPLTLAEIEQFDQALLAQAIKDKLEPFAAEGGFMVRGENYELLLAGEDLSADSLVLSAALVWAGPPHEGEAVLEGPRGSQPGMLSEQLLPLFLNDNPYLAGRQDGAVLYIAGELPAATMTGQVFRDGQQLQLVEYKVYYQAGDGVAQAGLQFTLEQGFVTAMRSFIIKEALGQQEAGEQLAALRDLQEQTAYVAFGDKDGSQLAREDFDLGGLDFFDSDLAAATTLLGQPDNQETLDNSDGSQLLVCQWQGLEAVFTRKGEATKLERITVNGGSYEGPRGLQLGDTLAQVLPRFDQSAQPGAQGGALYGQADKQEPPFGLMVVSQEGTQLYYAIAAQSGKAALILEFVDDVLVAMSLSYL